MIWVLYVWETYDTWQWNCQDLLLITFSRRALLLFSESLASSLSLDGASCKEKRKGDEGSEGFGRNKKLLVTRCLTSSNKVPY